MTPFEELLRVAKWNWAKTYAKKAPHWYCVREQLKNDRLFEEAVKYIRENSVTEYFYNKPFQYFYHGDYKYWTMGNPISETKIINRALV